MGLDMYLKAQLYLSGYDFAPEAEREKYEKLVGIVGLKAAAAKDTPSATFDTVVIYWRKANAIHRWFVENVQEGTDDCGTYYVPREKLVELRDTCQRALDIAQVSDGQPVHNGTTFRPGSDGTVEVEEHFELGRAPLNGSELAEILPTQGGFFFGSTGYDEWYLRDLEDTVKEIDRVLAVLPEEASLYYHSSW